MSLSSDLRNRIIADNKITAKVGGSSPRVSPYVRNSADIFPSIVYSIDNTEIFTSSLGTVDRGQSSVSVIAIDREYDEVDAIAKLIIEQLSGWNGSGAEDCISMVSPVSVSHDADSPFDGTQDQVYRVTITFNISHGGAI